METKVIFQGNDVQRIVFHYNKSTFSLPIYEEKDMKIYIYTLADPFTGDIRYVGKTNNLKTRFYNHLKATKKNYLSSWIKNLKTKQARPIMEVIDECGLNDWEFWEKYWISQFKVWGFRLTNLTNGGEGIVGFTHSDSTKLKMSESRKGKSTAWSIGREPWNKGKTYSEEERKKMSEQQTGKVHSEETKKRFSELRKGVPHNEEWNKKISQKLSQVQLGKKRGKYKPRKK